MATEHDKTGVSAADNVESHDTYCTPHGKSRARFAVLHAARLDIDLDQQTQQQQSQIEKEVGQPLTMMIIRRLRRFFSPQVAENQPLIGEKTPATQLQEEYAADDRIYQDKVAVGIDTGSETTIAFYSRS